MTLAMFVVDAEALHDDVIELAGAEGRHAVVVRRIKPGEHIVLTDTEGAGAECVVQTVRKDSLVAQVLVRRVEPAAEPRLVVVQAIPKGEYAERAVDLLTEIGVDEIVPWESARGVVAWRSDRGAKALVKWRNAANAAAKQSRRLRFPAISALHTTGQVADRVSTAGLALVLHESADRPVSAYDPPTDGEVLLVVGPEGGITEAELATFCDSGAKAARLGPSVLRSSTAGIAAAAAILSRTARWR